MVTVGASKGFVHSKASKMCWLIKLLVTNGKAIKLSGKMIDRFKKTCSPAATHFLINLKRKRVSTFKVAARIYEAIAVFSKIEASTNSTATRMFGAVATGNMRVLSTGLLPRYYRYRIVASAAFGLGSNVTQDDRVLTNITESSFHFAVFDWSLSMEPWTPIFQDLRLAPFPSLVLVADDASCSYQLIWRRIALQKFPKLVRDLYPSGM